MPIKVPRTIARFWNVYLDWVNVPIWEGFWRGRHFEMRRIDVIMALGFIVYVTWYWYTTGWQGALAGALIFAVTAMAALWMTF